MCVKVGLGLVQGLKGPMNEKIGAIGHLQFPTVIPIWYNN